MSRTGRPSRLACRDAERGFSLVELLVVVFIVAVLTAIAIPVFLGAQARARDRAAQSLARQTLVAAKTVFQSDEDYTAATVSALEGTEPGLTFLAGMVPSPGPDKVSVDAPDADTFVAAVYSLSGRCFYIRDHAVPVAAGGTTYAKKDSPGPDCMAADTSGLTFENSW
jgi:type IV pilus assembly protein PilA